MSESTRSVPDKKSFETRQASAFCSNHSIKDQLCETSSFFFQKQLILKPVHLIICLQRLPRTTLFELISGIYAIKRLYKPTREKTRPCMGFPGLYGIY